MRAIGTRSPGSLSSLSLLEVPEVEPRPNEVRVQVHASSANPADVKIVRWEGTAGFLHAKVRPLVPGYDLSGVVDEVGSKVEGVAEGDAVFGHLAYSRRNRQGAFAERVTIDAKAVSIKPERVDHATAAAAATTGLTALQALRDGAKLSHGARLLVLGASGGVGSLAVGIGKRIGAHVTGVCSTYAVDLVRSLGADAVIDRKTADPLGRDQPYDAVYDAVFDTTGLYDYRTCQEVLTGDGAFVTTMPSPSFALGKVSTLLSSRRCALVMVESRRDDLQQLGHWLAEGMKAPVAERFPVREAPAALERLSSGGILGKVAIDVLDAFEGS